jgi:hypothetical protein
MAKNKKSSKIKNPDGSPAAYKVKDLEVMTPEKKARAEAIAKAGAKDAKPKPKAKKK